MTGRTLLLVSVCFGLMVGLVEGVALLLIHGHGWGNPSLHEGVGPQIVWISAVANLLLFVGVALAIMLTAQVLPGARMFRVAVFLFTALAIADWIGVTGRISVLGTISLAVGLAFVLSQWLAVHELVLVRICGSAILGLAAITFIALVGIDGYTWFAEESAASRLPGSTPGVPNVLVVVVDTLRADHLSAYGYARATSPNFDRIAQQGVTFDNAIAPSSWTLPSHASMLTGRYPHEHRADWEQPLGDRYTTLPEVLERRGYRTAAFSANTDYFCHRAGVTRGFMHFDDYFYSIGDMAYRTFWGRLLARRYVADLLGWGEIPARRRAANVNRAALQWLDKDRRRPFFVFLNYFDAHAPYLAPREYTGRFTAPASAHCSLTWLQRINPFRDRDDFNLLTHMPPECFQRAVDRYDENIAYVDDQIGQLFAALKQRGLQENTLIFLTSDHGESFREHGLVTHGSALYRELIKVPLVCWWPGRVPAGEHITEPVSLASLPATIMELIGAAHQNIFPVRSFAQLWRDHSLAADWPSPLSEVGQSRYLPKHYPAHGGWIKSIVGPQWHLIISKTLAPELYSWRFDPSETRNIAPSPDGRQIVDRESFELWGQISSAGARMVSSNAVPGHELGPRSSSEKSSRH